MFTKIQQKIFSYRINKISKLRNIDNKIKHNFIWGLGHSGTHLLYDILACSKCFSYLGTLPPRKKGLFNKKPYPLKLAPQEGLNYFFDKAIPKDKKTGEFVFDHFLDYKGIQKKHHSIIKSKYSNIQNLINNYMLDFKSLHYSFVLDKSTNYSFCINPIKEIFPNSKHILLIRDPRAIFLSIINRKLKKDEYKSENNKDVNFLDFFSNKNKNMKKIKNEIFPMDNVILQICWMLDSFFKLYKLHEKDILIIYFEDLLNCMEKSICKIFSHFGITNYDKNFLERVNGRLIKSKAEGNKISIFDTLKINKKLFDDLNKISQELGYESDKIGFFNKDKKRLITLSDYNISDKFINSFF